MTENAHAPSSLPHVNPGSSPGSLDYVDPSSMDGINAFLEFLKFTPAKCCELCQYCWKWACLMA
ncbi:hypothetical protein CROQUDRAFT_101638 [Cronartium quercuum f. sp. fusiforme G11]|uniref:Uncharacterized protein n=1 Tax=Cronartium quercuum f. sp. fusiforme G11 TaxID=708437 RepID=A0A9P6T5J1_9BASI|nr:hypothetical protein CROQUDRAFT_101638 [Cronartium quercuum f. sp. fusiforme G11]